jgi:hypothetical protein
MLLVVAAAIVASAPPPTRTSIGASVRATATIRVISGVRLSFGDEQNDADVPRPRQTTIHTADAQHQQARLIEFQ